MEQTNEKRVSVVKIVLGLIFVCYILIGIYYSGRFCMNTWINGIYCTGMSVEEVNSELLANVEAPIILITDPNGNEYELRLSDMNYQANFLTTLNKYKKLQSPFMWFSYIFSVRNYEVEPYASYREDKLKEAFLQLEHVKEELAREEKYVITPTREDGYQLYDGLSRRLDVEKAFTLLKEAIANGETSFVLDYDTCYYDVELSGKQQETKLLWEKLNTFYQCDIVYDMGDEEHVLSPKVLSTFLEAEAGMPILSETSEFLLSEEGIREYVAKLAAEYDTFEKEREFVSTRGDVIYLTDGTYGTLLDQEAEVAFLLENLLLDEMHTGRTKLHIPAYLMEGFVRGKDDIGDTYVEVDMTEQKMYYYEAGNLVLETDVVTGNTRRKMGTPEGINFVYSKQTNRILRGEGYASPVKYWMPVNGNIGIHDARWRSEFGGEIYKSSGSHGCVNTPTEKMAELYEKVELGTPVIMFY
ncbi:MAG: L,D-transpeptidase family protein [Lachnospiraceae bacterium]|nr:L,D-transpeptidase family protein [Lachnospiraceae bacterium]